MTFMSDIATESFPREKTRRRRPREEPDAAGRFIPQPQVEGRIEDQQKQLKSPSVVSSGNGTPLMIETFRQKIALFVYSSPCVL